MVEQDGCSLPKNDFDVAIVGCGPVGVTLANMLGQQGLRVGIFEKESSVYHQPRASHMDAEVMRVYQALGLSETLSESMIGAKGYEFLNQDGKVLLKLGKPEGTSPHGWNYHYRFYQPNLEKTLRAGLERFQTVKVFLNHEVSGISEEDGFAVLQVVNKQNASALEVSSSFVIGCDGGRSMVRRLMGSSMDDVGLHQQWLIIDVKVTDKVDLPTKGIQYCDPARPITYVPMIGDLNRYRWEIMLLPGEQKEEMERLEQVWSLISPWVTPDNAEIERAAVYVFHSVIAKDWRKNNILLAGDSAHQTPPFLGQGMCAGVRDTSNLAWKLEMVINGKADVSLLDTYQSERSPHVRQFIDMATELGEIITILDYQKAAERDREFLKGPVQTLVQPTPSLGPGVYVEGEELAGTLFPQPRLDNGQLMDDVIGSHFAIIGDTSLINGVSETTRGIWKDIGAAVLKDYGSELQQILLKNRTSVIIIRPDRYVFGTANSTLELDDLTNQLQNFLKKTSFTFL